jgi:hypothetical protein
VVRRRKSKSKTGRPASSMHAISPSRTALSSGDVEPSMTRDRQNRDTLLFLENQLPFAGIGVSERTKKRIS